MNLIDDVHEEIMLYLNDTSLKSYGCVNHYTKITCSNSNFWIKKYHQLPLPKIVPTTLPQWINDYNNTFIAYHVLMIHKMESIQEDEETEQSTVIVSNVKYKHYPSMIRRYIQTSMHIHYNESFSFDYQPQGHCLSYWNGNEYIKFHVTSNKAVRLLQQCIQHELVITDNYSFPYLPCDIISLKTYPEDINSMYEQRKKYWHDLNMLWSYSCLD